MAPGSFIYSAPNAHIDTRRVCVRINRQTPQIKQTPEICAPQMVALRKHWKPNRLFENLIELFLSVRVW